jgi:phosphoglycolate phosphatase-like HAD superfamily hydrolase
VLTGGAGGRAMSCAFHELFERPRVFDTIPLAGRTDTWLLHAALDAAGIPRDDSRVKRFPDIYVGHLAREILADPPPGSPKGVLPGVRALLDALAGCGAIHVGLLTGNYERGARVKLEHFDLWKSFSGGAFGDEEPDRNALFARALASVRAAGGPAVSAADVVIVGDTPFDVEVASRGGARSIAVATGRHSVGELREAGADVVFEDLTDTEAVLRCLALTRLS